MTREEILKLEGRLLDAAVAKHVMGWTDFTPIDPDYDFTVRANGRNSNYATSPDGKRTWFPVYHREISSAWEVLNKLIQLGMEINVGFYEKWDCAIDYRGTQYDEQAETAPEAICKASLLAVLGI
ncbi:BC1872 family protein [Paenibacillus apii]|uniref:BC1872 family protein n=1 Tax=Paenibacillus apii TaxID=1850370 RepID=UPI00143929B4|nr:hypothetical protein [Paenibacillus apii]NJJ38576.1 hypothetical protein [Paenibacillus apii]